jgi:ABC-type sugar transport system permease subunit
LLLIPLGVPTIVAASTMRYVFGMVGYLNEVLYRLGLVTLPIDWTGSRWLAVVTVAMADAWKVTPLVMLILLAGLQAIPREIYEAARTDGAGPWQQFWRITLPLLRPALTMAFIIRGVDAFRIFALPLALPGLVVCGLLVWLLSWEEFTLATYLTLGAKTMPLQVYYYLYQGNWFDTAVAATLMTVPVLVLSAFLQRYLRETSLAGVMR